MKILVVGGAGYIGSHMVRMLLDDKFDTMVFDNLSTGHNEFVPQEATFVKGDLRDESDIQNVFKKYTVDAVMHFAASSIVPESVSNPMKYYENNVVACANLLKAMLENNVTQFIFSSTAAVYGEPKIIPIKETDETCPANPYGRSKLMIENMLKDVSRAHDFSYVSLRYFNAAGAHPSGQIGEMHNPETHLIPNILKVAKGEKNELTIFGADYPTPDGTCVRDFIHVQDLCNAHLLALNALKKKLKSSICNLGNGNGFSVKEVIAMAEKITGEKIRVQIGTRRIGDPAKLVASSTKAQNDLGWRPKLDLHEIIKSAWAWEKEC